MGIATFVFLSFLPTSNHLQTTISAGLLMLVYCIYKVSKHVSSQQTREIIRLLIIYIGLFFSLRYIHWRATETLPTQFGIVSMLLGLMLFLAESYGVINSILGYFINSRPLVRDTLPLPADINLLPHVDVYIPTYNEDLIVIQPTVIAATQLDYPKEKLHIYLLDDGGTAQKCNDANTERAEIARNRAAALKALCAEYGAGYITRIKNEHAKAGNINNALNSTSGDLLLILDCDHIPTRDFLQRTVGFFIADPKLFLVQTPHNFISPDPLEKNLATYETSPAENELFYDVMQPGLDFWGTSFFCGSAAVLRREVLDRLGGVAGQTITEDAETTLDALGLGYTTAYYNRPMVSGLQPETYSGFIVQRVRWGQGMLQIFLLKNPWTVPGLALIQRILYTNFAFYWGFAVSRLIMMLAPPVFLIFSINLCDANAKDLVAYAGPALICSLISTQFFYGRVRWPFMSQLYEIMQSMYVTQGIIEVLRRPRSPSFKVTPKGEVLSENFISNLSKPFYILITLNFIAVLFGVYRYIHDPWSKSAVAFVTFWAILDFILLLSALGVTFEKRQRRSEPRVAHDEDVTVFTQNGLVIPGKTINASSSGVGILLDLSNISQRNLRQQSIVDIEFKKLGIKLSGLILSLGKVRNQRLFAGVSYILNENKDHRKAINIAFGSSEQLVNNNRSRHSGRSTLSGLCRVIYFAYKFGLGHLRFVFKSFVFSLINKKVKIQP